MTAKVTPTWAALRAIYEGAQPSFALLGEAGRVREITVACRARREGWTDGWTHAVRRKQTARLQKQIDQLEGQIEKVIGGGEDGGIDKARLDILNLLLRSIEKLKDMMPSEAAQLDVTVRERDVRIGKILKHLDTRILELARHFAAKMAKADHRG